MSSLRFCTDNKALTGTVMNGGGGGAPARSETSPFTMEKALQHSRLLPWISATTPPSPTQFDVDLGAAQSIQAVGMHGFDVHDTAQVTNLKVYSGTTYPTFTLRATIPVGATDPRDAGAVLVSAISARYWRFEFDFTGGGTVGKFKVGKFLLAPVVDLGWRQPGPSAESSPQRYRAEGGRTLGGHPVVHDLGFKGRIRNFPFNHVTDAVQAQLEALTDQARTFAIFDGDDRFGEVLLREAQFRREFLNSWSGTLALEGLG